MITAQQLHKAFKTKTGTVKVSDPGQLDGLMDVSAYKAQLD